MVLAILVFIGLLIFDFIIGYGIITVIEKLREIPNGFSSKKKIVGATIYALGSTILLYLL